MIKTYEYQQIIFFIAILWVVSIIYFSIAWKKLMDKVKSLSETSDKPTSDK